VPPKQIRRALPVLDGVLLPNSQSQPVSKLSIERPSKPQALCQPNLFSRLGITITSLTLRLLQPT